MGNGPNPRRTVEAGPRPRPKRDAAGHSTVGRLPSYPNYSWTADTLAGMGIVPDFSTDVPLRYTHRRLASGDIYFVANTADQAVRAVCTFRTAGFAPEWWDPLTGETRDLGSYTQAGGVTRLPLDLGPGASGFVVFRLPDTRPHGVGRNSLAFRTALTLGGPWVVSFDPRWGGPAAVTFPALADWSQSPNPGIKYYSGKATYRATFALPAGTPPSVGSYAVSLGDVKDLASVRLNGHDLGAVWCYPWRVSVPAGLLLSFRESPGGDGG